VVNDLGHRHQAESHSEAEESARVCHKINKGNLLVPLELEDGRVLVVNVDEGKNLLGVDKKFVSYEVG
jgi:hypothetical protein